ncbi:MAG: potassium channel family protein [Nitrososphaera sp.]
MDPKLEIGISLLAAASVFLIIIDYSYALSATQKTIVYTADLVIVGILAGDFYVRMRRDKERISSARFIAKHWYEIVGMVPLVVFGIYEPSTIGTAAIRGLRLIRLVRIVHLFFRTSSIFGTSRLLYLVMYSAGAIILGAYGEYTVEASAEGANITNIGDAFWWAIVTVTTVGYGDYYPVTVEGKIIGGILMLVGISILGILISTLGAALVESRIRKAKNDNNNTLGKSSDGGKSSSSIDHETKELIKKRIDEIGALSEDDYAALLHLIHALRAGKIKK